MHRSAEQSEVQSRAIAADELHSRQDTFLRVCDMVREQLGVIAGFLYLSWASEHGDAEMRGEDGALALFKRQGGGDRSAFDRGIFGLIYGSRVGGPELFWGATIAGSTLREKTRATTAITAFTAIATIVVWKTPRFFSAQKPAMPVPATAPSVLRP